MNGMVKIQGRAVGYNSILYQGKTVSCWKTSMQAAQKPEPLVLTQYEGKMIEVSGMLHGDLWNAGKVKLLPEEGIQTIKGRVVGFYLIQWQSEPSVSSRTIECFVHGRNEKRYVRLNLAEYMNQTVGVEGFLEGDTLYQARIVEVPGTTVDRDTDKEAKTLNDLLRIREANRQKIEAINGNLGTALGFKWTNNQQTDHPCVIIFVPQKLATWLVPEEQKAPELLDGPDGLWCLTDVVTGGKAQSLEEMDPLPPLSEENEIVVEELKSGRIGLIGGIQIAAFQNGIEMNQFAYVGTAGIAVRHNDRNTKGFLTNQHVADAPGRRIYHPWHFQYAIGRTYSTLEYSDDKSWYDNVIDEELSTVRCDCGYVELNDDLESYLQGGLHALGDVGPLLKIDANTMDIINQKVVSVGRTRGVQRGTIVGYAYEYHDADYSRYTDLLVIGEDGKAFSWKGDSGKVLVTDDGERRPVALLWGGWQERLREGQEQENWTYAIDLGKVLERLKLELL